MTKTNKYLWTTSEWTFDLIEKTWTEIDRIATQKYKLDYYTPQIEVITSEQMLSAYSSVGMPVMYDHWSFGKQFVYQQKDYKRGRMGLAYEIVINSDPCIAYLMEENTMTMQALVLAHAVAGHSSFFKNNYLFKQWTDAESIVDYLLFAKRYIRECEEKYSEAAVEEILDSCHALQNYGVDRYKKPRKLSIEKEKKRQRTRERIRQEQVNDIWKTLPVSAKKKKKKKKRFPPETQENILYFIEKNSPILKPWQRELVRIIRKVAQYFYPQRQTQVMNEGWATFTHYNIMNDLYDEGLITEGAVLEFLKSHTSVVFQPEWHQKYFNGISPYALGFNMMMDLKRVCEHPTEEDKQWFPDIAGSDWLKTLHFAMNNFRDESFIQQFLSPAVIREMRLFAVGDNKKNPYNYIVEHIHDDVGYRRVREFLSKQYNLNYQDPDIQVYNVDKDGDRTLYLKHYVYNDIPLHETTDEVLKHIHRLWGYDIVLESVDIKGKVLKTYECRKEEKKD